MSAPLALPARPSRRALLAGAGTALAASLLPIEPLRAASGLTDAGMNGLDEAMRRHVDSGALPGLVTLVARGDDVRVNAVGVQDLDTKVPMAADTIFRIASLGKPMTAAAAMMLVEDGKIGLDDPVDRWLPELANAKVLKSLESQLDDTVPANRPVTLRDLLTMRFGLGAVMVWPPQYPIQAAMQTAGVAPGFELPKLGNDAYMKAIGALPLIHQPGQGWLYHIGMDVAGVLIARVSGRKLSVFMEERLFGPLGMADTGFFVLPEKMDRLASWYMPDMNGGTGLNLVEKNADGRYAKPPLFEAGGGGQVSTAADVHTFFRMMLGKGTLKGVRILGEASIEEMCRDQIPAAQKAAWPFAPGFWDDHGWGLGQAIITKGDGTGRFGWDGGYGTSGYADAANDLVGVMLTQRMMTSPEPTPFYRDFWKHAYGALPA